MPDFAVRTAFTAVDKVSPVFNRMGNAAETFTKKTSGLFVGLTRQLGILSGFALITMGFKKVVGEAANFEDSVANFTTLLGGSQTEAEKLVNTLQTLGAETPFQFKDLSDATQRLLGFGVATKDTVAPTLRMLGDLAQGNSEKLQGIALVYGQIMAGGKMMGQDFNQLINQGVPIAQGLAKVWGVDVNEAIKRVKQNGPVAAKDVQAAMIQMTSAGGMFYQGMMRSSKTLTGLWSTFMDAIGMTASVIGQELLPYIKDVVIWATDGMTAIMNFTKENKDIIGFLIKSIPWVVGGFLAWKVALYGIATAQAVMNIAGWIKYLWMMRVAIFKAVTMTKLWTVAQTALNVVMSLNPIGLIVIAIAALVTYTVIAIKHWDSFGAAMMIFLGPIGMVISLFKTLYDRWEQIKQAFSTGGIVAGLKEIGFAILDSLLYPIQQLLQLIAKIPGIGKYAAQAAAGIQGFREGNLNAPNKAATELQAGNINVNIYSNGTEAKAEVTPRRGATVNMNRLGYQQ